MPLHALARAGLAVTLLLGLVGTAHALTLKSEEFKTHRRPAVTFDHDNHNERAKIEDCIVCHHGGENGVIRPRGELGRSALFRMPQGQHAQRTHAAHACLPQELHRMPYGPEQGPDHLRRLPQVGQDHGRHPAAF